jgi:hypothetical protein
VAVSAVLAKGVFDVSESRVYGLYAVDRETLQRVFWLLGWVQANTGLDKEPLLRDLQDRLAKTFLGTGDAEPLPEVLIEAIPRRLPRRESDCGGASRRLTVALFLR